LLKYKWIIFDLDGTVYFGNQPAHKVNEVISRAGEISEYVFFLTNNSAQTREHILSKLTGMGIKVRKEELITSAYAITKYLKENGYKNVYCLGTDFLKSEIEEADINTNSKTPQAVVVGFNPKFKLDDLNELANMNLSDYKLIAANRERVYPKENGVKMPGAAPVVAAVEALLDKKADMIIGKPNVEILKITLRNLELKPENICIIGDSYDSDMVMAKSYGAKGILITEEKRNDCLCIEKLADLLELWDD